MSIGFCLTPLLILEVPLLLALSALTGPRGSVRECAARSASTIPQGMPVATSRLALGIFLCAYPHFSDGEIRWPRLCCPERALCVHVVASTHD